MLVRDSLSNQKDTNHRAAALAAGYVFGLAPLVWSQAVIDQAVFTLWYFHFALGERPDLTVVAVDLLHFDWYQETLRARYPSLVVPGPFPGPSTLVEANPDRPACYVQYSDRTEMNCSP